MTKTRSILCGLAMAVVLGGCRMEDGKSDGAAADEERDERTTLVGVVRPGRGRLLDKLEITSRVEAFERADIIPRIGGTVVKIHAFEGDEVKAGDVLAEIECREDELSRDSRRLAVSQAELNLTQAGLALKESKSRAQAAGRTLESQRRTFERAQLQHDRGALSDQDLETARNEYDRARAEKEQADVDVEKLTEDLKVKELMKEDAENMLRQAELRCEWARLRSTIDGRVTRRDIKLGQKTVVGQAAYSVADFDSLVIRPTIPEKELSVVKEGLRVSISTAAWPDKEFGGVVEFISPEIDVANGSVQTRIRLPRTDPPLLPGMFVSGHIITDERADVLLVPKKALLFDRERPYVFVLDRSDEPVRVRKVYIRRGLQDAVNIEYLPPQGQDRAIGDETEIVLVGLDRLFDGAAVDIEGEEEDEEKADEQADGSDAKN